MWWYLSLACGSPEETDTHVFILPDTAPDCADDAGCEAGTICEDQECVPGDRDDTFDQATTLRFEEELEGAFEVPGDVDTYAITVDEPTWIRLQTITDEDGSEANTVLQLVRENGSEIASVDDYPTGPVSTYDTVLYAYLAEAGTAYVRVEDLSSASGGEGNAGSDYTYTLEMRTFDSVVDDEPDDGADPDITIDLADRNVTWAVGVLIDAPGDVDFVGVDMAFADTPIEVYGWQNAGSSLHPHVTGRSPDGTVLAVQRDLDQNPAILLWSADGDHLLEVTDAQGKGDFEAWTVLYVTTADDRDPYELEVEPNDTAGSAFAPELVELALDDGSPYHAAYAEGQFGEGDSERLQVVVEEGETVSARCYADVWGSEAELGVTLLDALENDVTPAGQGTDPSDGNYFLWDAPIDAGLATIVLTDASGGFGPSHFWRCALFMASFDVDEG